MKMTRLNEKEILSALRNELSWWHNKVKVACPLPGQKNTTFSSNSQFSKGSAHKILYSASHYWY